MTTIKKKPENTKIRIERMINQTDTNTTDGSKHVAGGAHQGIVINKQMDEMENGGLHRFHDYKLGFKVYLINSTTKLHQQELRELKFWFDSISATQPDILWGKPSDRLSLVQQYFREMVNPDDFPKNYIPFIMKLMKTLQQPIYRPIVQMELEVSALDEQFRPPSATDSLACRYPIVDGIIYSLGMADQLPDIIPLANNDKPTRSKSCRGPPPPIPPKPKFLTQTSLPVLGLIY